MKKSIVICLLFFNGMHYHHIKENGYSANEEWRFAFFPLKGKKKVRLRASTVEPIWGTLLYFRKLKKVYTKGNDLTNKQVLMVTVAYNLKKLMGFNRMKTAVKSMGNIFLNAKIDVFNQILLFFEFICWFWMSKVFKLKKIMIGYDL